MRLKQKENRRLCGFFAKASKSLGERGGARGGEEPLFKAVSPSRRFMRRRGWKRERGKDRAVEPGKCVDIFPYCNISPESALFFKTLGSEARNGDLLSGSDWHENKTSRRLERRLSADRFQLPWNSAIAFRTVNVFANPRECDLNAGIIVQLIELLNRPVDLEFSVHKKCLMIADDERSRPRRETLTDPSGRSSAFFDVISFPVVETAFSGLMKHEHSSCRRVSIPGLVGRISSSDFSGFPVRSPVILRMVPESSAAEERSSFPPARRRVPCAMSRRMTRFALLNGREQSGHPFRSRQVSGVRLSPDTRRDLFRLR